MRFCTSCGQPANGETGLCAGCAGLAGEAAAANATSSGLLAAPVATDSLTQAAGPAVAEASRPPRAGTSGPSLTQAAGPAGAGTSGPSPTQASGRPAAETSGLPPAGGSGLAPAGGSGPARTTSPHASLRTFGLPTPARRPDLPPRRRGPPGEPPWPPAAPPATGRPRHPVPAGPRSHQLRAQPETGSTRAVPPRRLPGGTAGVSTGSPRRSRMVAAGVMALTLVAAGATGIVLSGQNGPRPASMPAPSRTKSSHAPGRGTGGAAAPGTAPAPAPSHTPRAASPSGPAFSSAPASTPASTASPAAPARATAPGARPGGAREGAGSWQRQAILSLLGQYFDVINRHDYPGYLALLTREEQQDWTAALFASGFRSTTDSGGALTGISPAPDGRPVAAVTFTSRQSPAVSVNHSETCTRWHILLFLEQDGHGYLIGDPPPGYTAIYA